MKKEDIEAVRRHLGGNILNLEVGTQRYAVDMDELCQLALKGLTGAPPENALAAIFGAKAANDEVSLATLAENLSHRYLNDRKVDEFLDDVRLPVALKALAQELETQDHRATSHPMYCVRQARYVRHHSTDPCADKIVWEDEEGNDAEGQIAVDLEAHFQKTYVTNLDAVFDDETCDYLRVEGETPYADTEYTKRYRRHAIHTRYDIVTTFFTNKAAEAYIEANKHNLEDPHVYVDSGWRNPEWQLVRALLMSLGRKL